MNALIKTPNSWSELMETLFEDDWDAKIERHRSSYAFRGMSDASWMMQTSIMRLGGNYASLENSILRNFKKYAYQDTVLRDTFWDWLVVGQHHGLPTRLLDWTYSPYVALHFATENLSHMNDDGVVWKVHIPAAHKKLPKTFDQVLRKEHSFVFTVSMLAELSRKDYVSEIAGMVVSLAGVKVQIPNIKPTTISSLSDFDKMSGKPYCVFFEPSSLDDRIVNQYALFSVLSDPTMDMNVWLDTQNISYEKIIIPKEMKWMVRDRLDQSNITERVIYPGLDGISKWLQRHYSPKK